MTLTQSVKYTSFDGLAYNTRGYFASCVVFFLAPKGRGKIRAMSKMSARTYGLETVVSVLFTNTRTRWPHNEREIFNTARGVAECSIENFEFIVRPASACICKQNTN